MVLSNKLLLLNLLIIILSLTSIIPLLLLRTLPATFGWALLTVPLSSLTSSLLSFSPLLSIPHLAFLLLSTTGEAFIFFSLLLYPDTSITLLDTKLDVNNVVALVRVEMAVMVAMFVLGSVALVVECMVVDEEKEVGERKRRRMARVEVEMVREIVEVEMDAFGKKVVIEEV